MDVFKYYASRLVGVPAIPGRRVIVKLLEGFAKLGNPYAGYRFPFDEEFGCGAAEHGFFQLRALLMEGVFLRRFFRDEALMPRHCGISC